MSLRRTEASAETTAGYVLLEVLVAVAVAGVLMAALLHAFSNAWGGITAVRENAETMLLTRTLLATAARRDALTPGTQSGTLGRYAWTITTVKPPAAAPVANTDTGETQISTWPLYRLDVTVTAPSGRSTSLEAFRLGKPNS
jgi:prepilin-type N-terminal cleavage/methylation domain-containing protein